VNPVRIRALYLAALIVTLSLSGCGRSGQRGNGQETSRVRVDHSATKMKEAGVANPSGNPAERPGVTVYRPKALPHARYDMGQPSVVDLDTGDMLVLKSGHRGGAGTFGLSNERTGGIAGGLFQSWSTQDVTVFEVTALSIADDGFRRFRPRGEYNLTRLAEMFRAIKEAGYRVAQPQSKTGYRGQVLVVDSRPNRADEIDRMTGKRVPS